MLRPARARWLRNNNEWSSDFWAPAGMFMYDFLQQVAVSPPPITVTTPAPVAATTASIIALVPDSNEAISNTPTARARNARRGRARAGWGGVGSARGARSARSR